MANFTGTISDEIITPNFVSLTVAANGGALPSNAADSIDGGPGNDTIDGGGGDDLLLGGDGDDLLTGGKGHDTITGGHGADTAQLGAGNDRFIWNQGDGSDTVDGQSGFDTLEFNGAVLGESIGISANGEGATLFRALGNITMAMNGVERIEVAPLGGADSVTVGDLSGTSVKQVAIDLGLAGIGDGQADSAAVNGTAGDDHIGVTALGTQVRVSGLPAQVTIDHGEATDLLSINGGDGNDRMDASAMPSATMALTLDGGTGNDTITGGHGADMLIGGDGNDTVLGGAGSDTAFLGAGDDTFAWNPGEGSDVVEGQDGVDLMAFIGSDSNETIAISANGTRVLVTRDVGHITMDINGVEHIVVSANGGDDSIAAGTGLSALTSLTIDGGAGNDSILGGDGNDLLIGGKGDDLVTGGRGADDAHLGTGNDLFIWNQGDGSDTVDGQGGFDTLVFNGAPLGESISISPDGEGAVLFRALGNITMDMNSIEQIEVAPLGGADTVIVNDLAGTCVKQVAIDLGLAGAGDGQSDIVTVNGTAGGNHIAVTTSGSQVTITGLSEGVTIDHAEAADLLSINGGDGNDRINASGVPADTMAFRLSGGDGNDILIGSGGDDVFAFNSGESGQDVILGFQVHGANVHGDVVALAGFTDGTFDQAIANGHITQSGADVLINDGANTIATLHDIALDSLHAQDFLFS